jgi:hypothetical protein
MFFCPKYYDDSFVRFYEQKLRCIRDRPFKAKKHEINNYEIVLLSIEHKVWDKFLFIPFFALNMI